MGLLLSSSDFQAIVQPVESQAVFLLDPAGLVATWNLGAQRLKGYAAEEIVGQHFGRLYTDEGTRLSRPDIVLRSAAARGRFEEEGWRRRRDGTPFWAHVSITAVRDSAERLVAFAKVTRDLGAARFVPEQAQSGASPEAPARPERSSDRGTDLERRVLAGVFEHVPEPSFLTDARGIVRVANAAAVDRFRVGHDFFPRRPLIQVVARQDTRPFRVLVKELADAPAGTVRRETVRMRARGGAVFEARLHATRIDAIAGVAVHWAVREPPAREAG